MAWWDTALDWLSGDDSEWLWGLIDMGLSYEDAKAMQENMLSLQDQKDLWMFQNADISSPFWETNTYIGEDGNPNRTMEFGAGIAPAANALLARLGAGPEERQLTGQVDDAMQLGWDYYLSRFGQSAGNRPSRAPVDSTTGEAAQPDDNPNYDAPFDGIRSSEFMDYNRNGIDDRDETVDEFSWGRQQYGQQFENGFNNGWQEYAPFSPGASQPFDFGQMWADRPDWLQRVMNHPLADNAVGAAVGVPGAGWLYDQFNDYANARWPSSVYNPNSPNYVPGAGMPGHNDRGTDVVGNAPGSTDLAEGIIGSSTGTHIPNDQIDEFVRAEMARRARENTVGADGYMGSGVSTGSRIPGGGGSSYTSGGNLLSVAGGGSWGTRRNPGIRAPMRN